MASSSTGISSESHQALRTRKVAVPATARITTLAQIQRTRALPIAGSEKGIRHGNDARPPPGKLYEAQFRQKLPEKRAGRNHQNSGRDAQQRHHPPKFSGSFSVVPILGSAPSEERGNRG